MRLAALVALAGLLPAAEFDVVVYGGTAGGVIAAVSAAREGLSVALLEPGRQIGGMTTGGLGRTDHGRKETIGGYSLEFYRRVGAKYGQKVTWYFEPHVAELVLAEMVAEAKVKVLFEHRLREDGGVKKRKGRITEIFCDNGTAFTAKVFIDATYEGDLLAFAKVPYTVGREATSKYGEPLAGVRPKDKKHQFDFPVTGYANGEKTVLLAEIQPGARGDIGSGDKKVQAYNFRLCLTKNPNNRVAFPKPKTYTPARYGLLALYLEGLAAQLKRPVTMRDILGVAELPNGKTDVNNRGAFSTDFIGGSHAYPEADYQTRAAIWQQHIDYTAGLLYFLANDPAVPETLRREMSEWGLAADEFAATNNWPHQLYVREARRMTGDFVMTQRDLQEERAKADSIGMGSYNSDSHNVQRYLEKDGTVQNEGNMEVPVKPYQIPYRVLVPPRKAATNLLVPVCVSSSHVAYSTLRMEPVYMIMGHAAGVSAKLAVEKELAVQDVPAAELRKRLQAQGAVLELRVE